MLKVDTNPWELPGACMAASAIEDKGLRKHGKYPRGGNRNSGKMNSLAI